jgi:hypothetical protein
LTLVGAAAEDRARAFLTCFEEAVQSLLDAPLDVEKVVEWTRLRFLSS